MVFGHSPETMWKLHLSAKFPQHEIRWNYGILSSVYKSSKFPNSSIHITFILNFQIKHCTKHWSFPLKISSVNGFQIWSFMRIWSHLLKESLMEKFIFCAMISTEFRHDSLLHSPHAVIHFKPCFQHEHKFLRHTFLRLIYIWSEQISVLILEPVAYQFWLVSAPYLLISTPILQVLAL